jgi:peptidoglycan hydrolase-like protein with peptidoglycan-binding domain
MFTLIQNYRTLFMLTIWAGLEMTAESEAAFGNTETGEVPPTPEQQEALDAVKGVTQKQLKDVVAVQNYLKSNTSVKEGAKGAAVKDIQEILSFLKIDISFISSRTGKKVEWLASIDGDYGSIVVKAVKEFQKTHRDAEGNTLTQDGHVWPKTYDAMLKAANIQWGVSAEQATRGEETLAASRVDTATAAVAAANETAMANAAKSTVASEELTTAMANAEREQIEHDKVKDEVDTKTNLLESASSKLESARTNLIKNNKALEAAGLAASEASGNITDFTQAEKAVQGATEALDLQTAEVEKINREIISLEISLSDTEKSYKAAGVNANREQWEAERAQEAFEALNYNGDVTTLPTLEEAQIAATAATVEQTAATAAQIAAQTAATAANTLWESYWFPSSTRKSAWETANAAAVEAKSKATATKDLVKQAEYILSVVEAQQSITKETTEVTTSATHLASMKERILALIESLTESASSLDAATIAAWEAEEKLLIARRNVTPEAALAAAAALSATGRLASALLKATTDVTDSERAIAQLQWIIDKVWSELKALTPDLTTAAAELASAEATLAVADRADESGKFGVARANETLLTADRELTAVVEKHEYNEYFSPKHALAALEGVKSEKGAGAIKAIQQALIDDARANLGSTGADGDPGDLTKAAVEAHPDIALKALAAYIDTTDNASVEARLTTERPAAGNAIDAALDDLFSDDLVDLDAALTQIAVEFTGKGIDANMRNRNAQYIALKLQSLGQENSPMAQSLMEKIMAEWTGNYENVSNEINIRQALIDGSGRFAIHLGTFPENFTGSYFKIGQTLQGKSSRARIENGMKQGATGNASDVLQEISGVDTDFVAHRMHVVTGQWLDGDADMSLELGGGISLDNAYYDEISGAIYATVAQWNGCEGNLVVIPVETFTPPIVKDPEVIVKDPDPIVKDPEVIVKDPDPIVKDPEVIVKDPDSIVVTCNGEQVKGTPVMEYKGYQVYVAVDKVFRVKDGKVESRNFGINEGLAWQNMSASNVRANIASIMENGSITFLWFTLSDYWETVGLTQNVCSVVPDWGDREGKGKANNKSAASTNPSDTNTPAGNTAGWEPATSDD